MNIRKISVPHFLLRDLPIIATTFVVALFGTRALLDKGMFGTDTMSTVALVFLLGLLGFAILAQLVAVPWGLAAIALNPTHRTWRAALSVSIGVVFFLATVLTAIFMPAYSVA